jgi:hypothetical protein|tara:strand:+ start:33 stop:395 length:363 start_codon:yes stop_codon:yes gene_type:complete
MAGPYKMKGSPMQRNFGIGSPMRDFDKKNQVGEKTYSPRSAKQGDFTSETDSLPSNYNSQSAKIDHDLQTKADFKGRGRNTQSRDSMTRIMKYEKGMVKSKAKGSKVDKTGSVKLNFIKK